MKAKKKKEVKYVVPMTVVKLVRKVQQQITEEPRRFDMGFIVRKVTERHLGKDDPPCGTVGCIAGWTGIIALGDKLEWRKSRVVPSQFFVKEDLMSIATKKLKLVKTLPTNERPMGVLPSQKNGRCTDVGMFYEYSWPQPYRRMYEREQGRDFTEDKAALAKIAVKRLDYYLRTGK